MATRFRVTLTDRPEPVDVEVKYLDMVVAESEAPRHGIPNDPSLTPLSLNLVWIWCALRRTGAGVGSFQEFRAILDDVETIREPSPVPPTLTEESSDSSSTSPPSGPL